MSAFNVEDVLCTLSYRYLSRKHEELFFYLKGKYTFVYALGGGDLIARVQYPVDIPGLKRRTSPQAWQPLSGS